MNHKAQQDVFEADVEDLLAQVVKDFSHFTILLSFYNRPDEVFSMREIAQTVSEPKNLVSAVIHRFMGAGLVQKGSENVYQYVATHELHPVIFSLLKLWRNPGTHHIVLGRLTGFL